MSQTEFHQRLKQVRFKEVYNGDQCKRLTQSEAASLLGVCDRSFIDTCNGMMNQAWTVY